VTSKPDFKVMVLLLVFMQLTRDLFAIAKFLFYFSLVLSRKMHESAFFDCQLVITNVLQSWLT